MKPGGALSPQDFVQSRRCLCNPSVLPDRIDPPPPNVTDNVCNRAADQKDSQTTGDPSCQQLGDTPTNFHIHRTTNVGVDTLRYLTAISRAMMRQQGHMDGPLATPDPRRQYDGRRAAS